MNESDQLAIRLFGALVKDFRLTEGNDFASKALACIHESPVKFREYQFPELGEVSVNRFKAYRQLSLLFKRYRFENDVYSDEQLVQAGVEKYLSNQIRLGKTHQLKATTLVVLSEARKFLREFLSLPYGPENYRTVGKRAELRCTLDNAYADNKVLPEHFSCPKTLKKELLNELASTRFGHCLRRINRKDSGVDYLKLQSVPKNWKTLRWITPLTTYGLYWSYGIKGYIELCLEAHGMKLSKLEARHRDLVKRFSVTRTHVTADLSAASDSLTSELLNRLLPRWMYNDLKKTFVRNIKHENRMFYTCSVLPMGNAATFPVETIIFYSLIRAIGRLTRVKGTYSTYGDDLIYPRRIHKYVVSVFSDLGLNFNHDKTCVESFFRESCGGDYYHGCDVRPFLYPEDRMPAGRLAKLQYLYKIANSILKRWDATEVRHTLGIIYSEIIYLYGRIFVVPPSYPETSGLRQPSSTLFDSVVKRGFSDGTGWFKFEYITNASPKRRCIKREDIYLHLSIAGGWAKSHRRKVLDKPVQVLDVSTPQFSLVSRREKDGFRKFYLTEATHSEGAPRTAYAQISSWT